MSNLALASFLDAKPENRHWKAAVYGAGGCGKTYLAACAEKPLFIRTEDRHRYLPIDVDMLPLAKSFRGSTNDDMSSLLQQLHLVKTLDHDYQTLVIDGLSGIADIFKSYVLDTKPKGYDKGNLVKASSLEDYGFNIGYGHVMTLWQWFLNDLDTIAKERNMNILLLCHSVVRTHKSPIAGEDYDAWSMNLFDQKNLSAEKAVQQWCDFVFFMKMETLTTLETTGIGKNRKTVTKAVDVNDEPARCLFTADRSAFFAKNSKPETIEFMYELDGIDSCKSIFELMK